MAKESPASPKTLWQKNFQTLRAVLTPALYISFLGFVLPQIALELIFAPRAGNLVEIIKDFTDQAVTGGGDFFALGTQGMQFSFAYIAYVISLWVFSLIAYHALVFVVSQYCLGRALPPLPQALGEGFKFFLPKGLVATFLFFIVFGLSQVVFPPLILLAMPGVMAPVLIIAEKRGSFSAVKNSLSLGYAKSFPLGKFNLLLQIVSLGAILYAALLFSYFIFGWVLEADLLFNIPRSIWNQKISGYPFHLGFLLAFVIKVFLVSLVCCLIGVFSTSTYYWIKALKSPLPKQGIQA